MELNYIVTESGPPESYDPLEADRTVNLTAMRMLYATPIEISKDNTLISNLLETFEYNRESKIITFKLRANRKYSDNSMITIQDIALAIARMAYFRPTFPIIKDIIGIDEWKKSGEGLTSFPKGIIIENQSIKIFFSKSHLNPLFRFCLELFSVIPERCIDLATGKMICKVAPSSGYYVASSVLKDQIVFNKREKLENTAEIIPYKKITFKYENMSDACGAKIPFNSIISGNEIAFIKGDCSTKVGISQVHWTPAARFSSLIFNPTSFPFNKKENRQYFSELVRENIHLMYPHLIVEKSLFSPLLPGYISSERFISNNLTDDLSKNFKNVKIYIIKRLQSRNIAQDSIEEVAKKLSMSIEYLDNPSDEELDQAFKGDKFKVDTFSSGFWAQDPVGDLSMFFTPGLHNALTFVWKDKEVYKILEKIENETEPYLLKEKMEKLNLHLFDESLISPVIHFRRVFITSEEISMLNQPQSITSPAPWQLIPVE